ncbi:MAG: STAS domain-containing protein [Planctomycetota bacterium]|nr:STAS domain-containing protein [Planctomycetota bacterium]
MYPCKRSGAVDTISGSQPLTRDHQSAFLNSVESCFGNGQPRIVFDMIHVPLMDSVGMEALLEARDRCHKLGGSIVLARPTPLCRDILRINGIDKELNVYDDAVKAMGSFAK